MLRDMCRTFADTELAPKAGEWDQAHKFPADAVKEMGNMGLMGVSQPAEFGGSGMDVLSYAIAIEEISRGCAGTGVIMSAHNSLYCDPLRMFGTDAQKEEWLTPWASGDVVLSSALASIKRSVFHFIS